MEVICKMILHHGTYCDFDKIDLSISNRGKDFGKGFYLTDDSVKPIIGLSLNLFSFIQHLCLII